METISNFKLNRIAKKLEKKYTRVSFASTKHVKSRTKLQSSMFSIGYFLLSCSVLCCAILCFSAFFNAINHTPSTLFGYSTLSISNLAVNDFASNDILTIKNVDPHTLKQGDIIAFYPSEKSNTEFFNVEKSEYTLPSDTETKFSSSFLQFIGFHSPAIYSTSQTGAKLTIGQVTNCFKDVQSKLWFKAQGLNSAEIAKLIVDENSIVGIYVTNAPTLITTLIQFFSSITGLVLLILFPIVVIFGIFFQSDIKNIKLNKLEQDVIEQKIKLTDPICVKNEIGYRMPFSFKLKVLSQASQDELARYVSLLWRDGYKPSAVRKYVHKNQTKLSPIRKLCALNNECEARFRSGEDITQIAKYYLSQKNKINKQTDFVCDNKG